MSANKKERYRLIFWGPGHLGGGALRTILSYPEFEVVGARVFDQKKNGVDLGVLLGMDPIGVLATTDIESLLQLEADCVIHTTQAFDTQSITDEVLKLLESGKNIVSTAAFHYPMMRGPEYADRLEKACLRGSASLMGAGLHPSLIVGNFVIPASGAMSSIDHICVTESVDLSRVMAAMGAAANDVAVAMGFGADPAAANNAASPLNVEGLAAKTMDYYQFEQAGFIGKRLFDAEPHQIRMEAELIGNVCEKPYTFATTEHAKEWAFTIDAGTTVSMIRRQRFYLDDRLFLTNENHWFLGEENRSPGQDDMPFTGSTSNVNYGVVIEGLPNTVRVQFSIDEMAVENAPPIISLLSINSLVQSIVPVCNAPPGLFNRETAVHFASDLRALASRRA